MKDDTGLGELTVDRGYEVMFVTLLMFPYTCLDRLEISSDVGMVLKLALVTEHLRVSLCFANHELLIYLIPSEQLGSFIRRKCDFYERLHFKVFPTAYVQQ